MSGKSAKRARREQGRRGNHRHSWVPDVVSGSGWSCEASFCEARKENPPDLGTWLKYGAS